VLRCLRFGQVVSPDPFDSLRAQMKSLHRMLNVLLVEAAVCLVLKGILLYRVFALGKPL
jgi:hypothetical protein